MQNDYFSVPRDIYEDVLHHPDSYLHYYTYDGRECARHLDKSEQSPSLKIDKKIFEDIRHTLFLNPSRKRLQGNFCGASLSEFVHPHLESTYLLKFDIVRCFNSVTYDLFEQSANGRLDNLDMVKAVYFKPNLMVGLSASSIIAEVVLVKIVDNFINALLHSKEYTGKNIIYTRFYDDIYLSANDRDCLAEVQAKITQQLTANGFTTNQKKTSLSKVENSTILKNRISNGRICVGKRFKNNLRLQMHFYRGDATDLDTIQKTIAELNSIIGKIAHILRTETNPAKKWVELEGQYTTELHEFDAMRTAILMENMGDLLELI